MIPSPPPQSESQHRPQASSVPAEPISRLRSTVSVIVCAYTMRRWDDIRAAIDSLLIQTIAPDEILLVVDHNPELFDRALRTFGASMVRVVANEERQGLSGGRNTGVAAATMDVVAFLDDDASADIDWIERLVSHYQNPMVFGVGGFAAPKWPNSRPAWLPTEFDWVVGCSYTGQPTTLSPVRNFIGCNMSLRRSVFAEIGGFSHEVGRIGKTPLGCEETELCIRVTQKYPEAKLMYDPSVRVEHRVTADRTMPRYFLRRCYNEGLSKAVVSKLVGSSNALASERTYVSRTLPRGVVQGVIDSVIGRDGASRSSALARSVAVVVGLTCTVAGYVIGRLRTAVRRRNPVAVNSMS